jgi:hypothetical protein
VTALLLIGLLALAVHACSQMLRSYLQREEERLRMPEPPPVHHELGVRRLGTYRHKQLSSSSSLMRPTAESPEH